MVLNSAKIRNTFLSAKDWGKIALSLLIILLTDSRSALIGILLFFIAYYWKFILRHTRIFLSFVVVLLVSLTLFLTFSNTLETILINLQGSFSLDSYYIRGIIINMAIQITYLHFPIGTGAATFGTVLSDGSPVYEYFGVAKRYFFVEKKGIYDSSVASIVGEYGFIGICFYSLLLYYLWRFLKTMSPNARNSLWGSLFLAFIFYSVTNPTFTNNIYILMSIPIFLDFIHRGRIGLGENPGNNDQ